MTTCPVCNSTDIRHFYGISSTVETCWGCGRTLSVRTLTFEETRPLPSADEMVAVAEAIVRGRA